MGYGRQSRDDWEIRQGIPKQWDIDEIEAGKPPGDVPPPVAPPDNQHSDVPGAAESSG
jgi:hypothetical protein